MDYCHVDGKTVRQPEHCLSQMHGRATSTGRHLFEDLPQLILTAYIDYITFSGGLTPSGMMNICSSLTALINRMTIKYDEYESEENKEADQYEMMNL